MPKTLAAGDGCFVSARRKIQASGILDALIEYAQGRREMSASRVSAAPDHAEIEIRIVDLQR
ncbi:MAG: hypothetical protein AB7S92_19715 [Parvibaculaceae bacterium]